jgi:hypothetical protein
MKTLTWLPRILVMVYILFISMFALDSFNGNFWLSLLGFLIHLIPSFVLTGILILSWKYKLAGGIIFVVLSIVFTIFFSTYKDIVVFLLISLPLLIIGTLFIVDSKVK